MFKVFLFVLLVGTALAIPAPQAQSSSGDVVPTEVKPKEEGRDIDALIEAAVTGDEEKLGLLPRVALKLAEAGGESARGKLKLKKLLPLLALIPMLKLLLLPIAILFLKGLTLKALIVAKIALVFALINAGRSLFSKGGSSFGGLGGLLGGGGGGEHYSSYESSGHGHGDSYGGSSYGHSRSFLDEAEAKVNQMIETAASFFEGAEEPQKTE